MEWFPAKQIHPQARHLFPLVMDGNIWSQPPWAVSVSQVSGKGLLMLIRSAVLSDLPTIVEFNRLLAHETESIELSVDVLKRGVHAALLDPQKARYFVAEIDGQIVGQLMHTREWSDWRNGEIWWLQSVYVAASARRQGVFRRLVEHVSQLAQSNPGVVGLRLYVEEHNDRAAATYDRLGLKEAGYVVRELIWRSW